MTRNIVYHSLGARLAVTNTIDFFWQQIVLPQAPNIPPPNC